MFFFVGYKTLFVEVQQIPQNKITTNTKKKEAKIKISNVWCGHREKKLMCMKIAFLVTGWNRNPKWLKETNGALFIKL